MAASVEVCLDAYREILRTARRFARSEDEARDLVQDALVIALARGFDDWSSPARRGWLRGVVRKRAAFVFQGSDRSRAMARKRRARPRSGTLQENQPTAPPR